MTLAPAPLPLDFVALSGSAGGLEVVHFVGGRRSDSPQGGARLVLHAQTDDDALGVWRATGALVVPAERLLALLAPEERSAGFAGAADVGERYVRAARRMRPQSEALRAAAELLPLEDAALRALLHRALGVIAEASLGGRSFAGAPEPGDRAAVPAPAFAWRDLPLHDLLDQALAHLHAWRRVDGAPPFEPRGGQRDMAHAVLDAMLERRALVVEAGTGVGKTIAYALPALVLAAAHGARVVFSTHTRNLQQQLVGRDLPELWRAFGLDAILRPDGSGRGLRYAKLLGRSNYVCRTALGRAVRRGGPASGFARAQALVWSLGTASGELDEIAGILAPELRHEIESRRETCLGGACRGEPPCPVYAARDAARAADLVVVNHALLFSDAASEGSLLGLFDAIVLDEAHHLEDVATEHRTIRFGHASAESLRATLGRLGAARAGLDPESARGSALLRFGSRVAATADGLDGLLDTLGGEVGRTAQRRGRVAYHDGDEVFGEVRPALDSVFAMLRDLGCEAGSLVDSCLAAADPAAAECVPALDAIGQRSREMGSELEFLAAGDHEDWAFYLDFGADGSRLHEIAAAPLDVAADIQAALQSAADAAVYTSATLAVGDDFAPFLVRVGLPGGTPTALVPSPFDYPSQCLAVQAQHLPDYDAPDFESRAADLLAALARRAPRRTLVLLTSYGALRRLHAELARRLGPRAPLFSQEISGSREHIAARFAATPGALLLGTASFWEGVDFPGEALELLVIAKLPFRVPDDPLVAARAARMRRRGEDPFGDWLLPDAVLRFKQGFGRLVRSREDRGAVLFLDPRLGERGYGRVFLRSLPTSPEVFHEPDALVERVVGWLERRAAR